MDSQPTIARKTSKTRYPRISFVPDAVIQYLIAYEARHAVRPSLGLMQSEQSNQENQNQGPGPLRNQPLKDAVVTSAQQPVPSWRPSKRLVGQFEGGSEPAAQEDDDASSLELYPGIKAIIEADMRRLETLNKELDSPPMKLVKPNDRKFDELIAQVGDLGVSPAIQRLIDDPPEFIAPGTAERIAAEWEARRKQSRQDANTSPMLVRKAPHLPDNDEPLKRTLSYLEGQNKRRKVDRSRPEPAFILTQLSYRPVCSFQQTFDLNADQYGCRLPAAGRGRDYAGFERSPSSAPSPGPSTVADRFDQDVDPHSGRTLFPVERDRMRTFRIPEEEQELSEDEDEDETPGSFDPAQNLGGRILYVEQSEIPNGGDEEADTAVDGSPAPRVTSNITARRSRPAHTALETAKPEREDQAKLAPSVIPLPLFLYDSSRSKPIPDLPTATKECLKTALNRILNQNLKSAATVTKPANSGT
ncbi:hypothetical protein E8E12_001069 [Didymella heteroderae]|uniref:Uncharacterized protein n=1 Tax=Didymella heteroderae TaxID=1769908 RepID=A0A9P4WKH7_9PLEO|nr:hypothetical protein E8E12_001069 [Didymella heteroderae]